MNAFDRNINCGWKLRDCGGKEYSQSSYAAWEPLQFGITEGKVEEFLTQRGFTQVASITSEDYKRAYFHGKNESRDVSSLLLFVHAVVE
jgi:O-methyltransferase involved in polyketide biosynthesis